MTRRPLALLALAGLALAACSADSGSAAPDATTTAGPGTDRDEVVAGVDLSKRSVRLEDVYFDTFDGASIPLPEASPTDVERLLDAIPPLDHPAYEGPEGGAWLDDDDLVLGYVTDAGDAYAYPHRILAFHEIVNDDLGGVPVLVSYCPLCDSGVVYDRRVDERTLTFGNSSALYENDLVMVDRETSTYWWQVPGRAIVGALTGAELSAVPSATVRWAMWRDLHPDTRVLSRDLGFGIDYTRRLFAGYAERLDTGETPFPVSEGVLDGGLLAPSAKVVGVDIAGDARAFPVVDEGAIAAHDDVGGEQVVVFLAAGGGRAFRPVASGRTLTFGTDAEGGFVDAETGTRWDAEGRAVAGPLAGETLEPLPARSTFWFAYVASFPAVTVWSP